MKKHFNIPIFIPHLGCPFDCIFCNQKKISSTIVAPKPVDIKKIVDEHLDTIPEDSFIEIAFFGGSFTAIDKNLQIEYLKAVQPYLKSDQVNSIRLSTRPDFIDPIILKHLREYGVKTIELGVQSLNDEVLKKSCRAYSVDDVFKASHLIKSFDFKLGIQLMVGLPGDKYEYDIETTKKTISLKPDMVRIYPTLVIEDTALKVLYEKGLYKPLPLDEAITTTKEMYLYFIANDINVIRMGLYPSEDLHSGDALIAGPFHPAFGELVEQEVFYDQVQFLIESVQDEINLDQLFIFVNPRDMSKMVGNKRQNITKLKNSLHIEKLVVRGWDLLRRNSIGISQYSNKPSYVLTLDEYLRRADYV